jgi:uncharacterized protein YbjQ (UPF0145 family)
MTIMMIVTTDYITGKKLEILGIVKGQIVQSKNIGRDIGASFKTLIGGEIKGYTDMLTEARAIATRRMVEEAECMGADAVIDVKFASAAVMAGAAEILAYGTAVKFINE